MDGMAVTCVINNYCSGVGYVIESTVIEICGIEIFDDSSNPMYFKVDHNGEYSEIEMLMRNSTDIVTSQMLAKGARKPIILTPETTEVDEKTYKKLLSDDVDVVFKDEEDNFFYVFEKTNNTNTKNLSIVFQVSIASIDTIAATDYIFGVIEVTINKDSPHRVDISYNDGELNKILDYSGYLNKSALSPVLQEIDLSGTDAERKANLDEFETVWKDLTGASDMTGARFVGRITVKGTDVDRDYYGILVRGHNGGQEKDIFTGFISGDDMSRQGGFFVILQPDTGELTITPLATQSDIDAVITLARAVKAFGAIELKASDNAANKAALTAYLKILTDAGISTTNGYSVPVRITGNAQEYHGMLNIGTGTLLSGIVTDVNENHHYPFNVSTSDGAITFDANNYFLEKTSNEVTEMLDAIKYSYTPVPLTATTLSNKAQLEVFLSKVPNAKVMHVTYKDVYAGTLHKINGDWFGLLVKNTNNYEDALQVKLQADGTLIEGTTSLAQVNAKLDTIIG